uniref:Uncharacterized protein n=1 Tax=Arundo donax TaxID=35708 RepID=A0A0A9AHP0_ARUDO
MGGGGETSTMTRLLFGEDEYHTHPPTQKLSLHHSHQLKLNQRQVIVLLHCELSWAFSSFHDSPLVHCKPHRTLEHVNLRVPQLNICPRLHYIHCTPKKRFIALLCRTFGLCLVWERKIGIQVSRVMLQTTQNYQQPLD